MFLGICSRTWWRLEIAGRSGDKICHKGKSRQYPKRTEPAVRASTWVNESSCGSVPCRQRRYLLEEDESTSSPYGLRLPEPPLANLGECSGQGYQPLRLSLNVGRGKHRRHRDSGYFMGASEHLFHQAGSRNKYVAHFAI